MRTYELAPTQAIELRTGLQEKCDGKALFSKEIEKDNASLKGLEAGRRTALKLKSEVRAAVGAEQRASLKLGKVQLKSLGTLVDVLKAPNAQCLMALMALMPSAQFPNARCPIEQCPFALTIWLHPPLTYGDSLQHIWLQAPEPVLKARSSAFLSALPPAPPASPGARRLSAAAHHQPPSSKPPSAAHVQEQQRRANTVVGTPGTPGTRTMRGRAARADPASTPGTPGTPGVQSNGLVPTLQLPNPKHMC